MTHLMLLKSALLRSSGHCRRNLDHVTVAVQQTATA